MSQLMLRVAVAISGRSFVFWTKVTCHPRSPCPPLFKLMIDRGLGLFILMMDMRVRLFILMIELMAFYS